ncbi:hypothetical protein QR680_017387 [Steinernema hermaphroditum]|uniref:PDZ domain-containing protein n=1 Tax=Steinernema hermaphroditum TaxID=289476 RepID=A0AA39HED9_9BILA|nr:hypothetical protein QR680_017387 [Steinernema hermaphroditum]
MKLLACIPLFACQRRVESLDFGASKLEEVPEGIERYAAHLRELVLDTNDITELPEGLFQCRKLERLSLQGNLVGDVTDAIGNLKNLVELNLESNEIMDLPKSLGSCTSLQLLSLSRNTTITTLPSSITQLSALRELYLSDTNLTDLPSAIGNLVNLEFLELRKNELRDHSIPPSVSSLQALRHLDLGENKLSFLPDEIGDLSELRMLIVDENELDSLPETLTACAHLEELDVSKNRISRLPDAIGDLGALAELRVGANDLHCLPSSIGRLKQLSILNVEGNHLDELTPAIGGCLQLNDFYASSNLISVLPSTIGHLRRLKNLHLDNNRILELPSSIGNCASLSVLSLRSNELSELPMEIGKLGALTVLDVCGNRLSHLPFTITVPPKLRAIWLSLSQPHPKMVLTETRDPATHVRVYTCVLLPQSDSEDDIVSHGSGAASQKVKFEDSEFEEDGPSGRLVRRGTPHRKCKRDAQKAPETASRVMEFKEPTKSILKTRKAASDASDEEVHVEVESVHEENEAVAEEETVDAAPRPEGRNNASIRVEVAVERGEDGELGWTIAGGVESAPVKANDNGIYVTKVLEDGPTFRAGIRKGDRLLQANGRSLEGATHSDAVELLRVPEDVMRFVVLREFESAVLDEEEVDLAREEEEETRPVPQTANLKTIAASLEHIPPLSASSPLPPSPLESPSPENPPKRALPPVAPKPSKEVIDQVCSEKLDFSSKIKEFETKIGAQTATTSVPQAPPSRRTLLSSEEVEKLKQKERKKILGPSTDFDDLDDSIASFRNILDECPLPSKSLPSVVRTKKAENRLLVALSPTPSTVSELSVEEQQAKARKRSEWRQLRLQSIIKTCASADELIRRVHLVHSRMENIDEDGYCSPTPTDLLKLSDADVVLSQ